jgi:CBS domain-containing protein
MAQLEKLPDDPRQQLAVAIVGPAVNFAIAAVVLAVVAFLRLPLWPNDLALVATPFLTSFLWINVSLGVFNLLPAFPMDGGRALRAILARRMEPLRATRVAAQVGRGMAVLFAVVGVVWQPMLVLIAVFVWTSAGQEAAAADLRLRLRDVRLETVMVRQFASLAVDTPLAEAHERMRTTFQPDFPVLASGRLVGMLERGAATRALRARAGARVGEVMRSELATAAPDQGLDAVLEALEQHPQQSVAIVDDDRVVGLVTLDALLDVSRTDGDAQTSVPLSPHRA